MSTISKRLLDLAKSNLNSILERAAEQTDPRRRLAGLSDSELEAELARRRTTRDAQRKIDEAKAHVVGGASTAGPSGTDGSSSGAAAAGGAAQPSANAGAAGATTGARTTAGGAGSAGTTGASRDRAERERQAREREDKVRAAREARDRVAQEQQARAREQQARSQAKSRGSAGSARGGGGAGFGFGGFGGGARPGARAAAAGRNPDLSKHYAVLEVPAGSDWETVKASYRKLMRKYHPDLHGGTPAKLKAATEVSQALTIAYNELEKALLGGPNRSR